MMHDVRHEGPRFWAAAAPSRGDWWLLLGILVLCLGVRVWICARSEIITTDGVHFIKLARAFQSQPSELAWPHREHPGYPVAIAALHRVLVALGIGQGVEGWELAGRAVSLLAALAATVALWRFAWLALGPAVAACTVLLTSVSRKWAILGSDVVSDAPAVCLELWTVVLALETLRRLGGRNRWAPAIALATGLCGALAYLFRPEGLVAPLVAACTWVVFAVRWRPIRLRTAGCVAAMLAGLACGVVPYTLITGRITTAIKVQDYVARGLGESAQGPMTACLAAATPGQLGTFRTLVNAFFEAQQPALATLTCLCALVWLAQTLRGPKARQFIPLPQAGGGMMMAGVLVAFLLMLTVYYRATGLLSYRYLIFPALLLSPMAGSLVVQLGRLALAPRLSIPPFLRRASVWILAGAMTAAIGAHALGNLPHKGKYCYRDAGRFLAADWRGDDVLLADKSWVPHYAQAPALVQNTLLDGADVINWAYTRRATCIAVSGHSAADVHGRMDALTHVAGMQLLAEFPAGGDDSLEHVLVFRCRPEMLAPRVRYAWALDRPYHDGWQVLPGVRLANDPTPGGGTIVTTLAGSSRYQAWSPAVDVPPGPCLLQVEGEILGGELSAGVTDMNTGAFIASASLGSAAAMTLRFTAPARMTVQVCLSNGVSLAPNRWRITRVLLGADHPQP